MGQEQVKVNIAHLFNPSPALLLETLLAIFLAIPFSPTHSREIGELHDALRDDDLKPFFDEVNFARGAGNFRELLDHYKNRH